MARRQRQADHRGASRRNDAGHELPSPEPGTAVLDGIDTGHA